MWKLISEINSKGGGSWNRQGGKADKRVMIAGSNRGLTALEFLGCKQNAFRNQWPKRWEAVTFMHQCSSPLETLTSSLFCTLFQAKQGVLISWFDPHDWRRLWLKRKKICSMSLKWDAVLGKWVEIGHHGFSWNQKWNMEMWQSTKPICYSPPLGHIRRTSYNYHSSKYVVFLLIYILAGVWSGL